jgi:excisionase family DNA binding protein
MSEESLLTVAEVAELLGGIPVNTLYAWRYKHEGPPACRIGKHLRYRRDDLREWIERQTDRGAL